MAQPKPHILFVYPSESSFVKEDLRILSDIAIIHEFNFLINPKASKITILFSLLIKFVQQLFWFLKNQKKADLIYCWFADYHAFLPIWLAKKRGVPTVTVLGGVDCINQPSINYGVYTSAWRKPLATYIINNTSLLLPVDRRLIQTDPIAKHWPEAHPNGIAANIPSFDTSYRALPTGYDPFFWEFGPLERQNSVCTVSISHNIRTAKRKGIDLVIRTAQEMPDIPFTIVGLSEEVKNHFIKTLNPSGNIQFLDAVPRQELNKIYGNNSIYLQLSRAEGLPNVLCEAMMCGCIPVGSPVFGIPHGIGETGFVVEKPDPKIIASIIQKAFQTAPDLREKARQRVIENFSIQKRRESLKQVLYQLDVL